MNVKSTLAALTLSIAILLGYTTVGFAYTTSTSFYGVTEKKEGYKTVKKRYVSAHSMSQMIDKAEEVEYGLDKYPKVRVVATGYYAGYESTGKTPGHPLYGITYSGIKVHRGAYSTIAADLTVFPLGSVLYIPDYGFGVVADTGSAIRGHKIDLYFETKQDVFTQWGRKVVDIYVVHKGRGEMTEEMMRKLTEQGVEAVMRMYN